MITVGQALFALSATTKNFYLAIFGRIIFGYLLLNIHANYNLG
jgi:hypothetical protein